MADPYFGEIRMFGGTFAPRNWGLCDGALLPLGQNTALFTLMGTMYGGDGRTTIGLPDMRNRTPMGVGNGPGLTPRIQGQRGGISSVVVTEVDLPSHTHDFNASAEPATAGKPASGGWLASPMADGGFGAGAPVNLFKNSPGTAFMSTDATGSAGNSTEHENRQPFLKLLFIICLFGLYPSRP